MGTVHNLDQYRNLTEDEEIEYIVRGRCEDGEALLIRLRLSDEGLGGDDDFWRVWAIQDALECAFAATQAGCCDGHEFGGGWAIIFCYGASAAQLLDVALPVLMRSALRSGACAVKRYGPPGARKEVIDLGGAQLKAS